MKKLAVLIYGVVCYTIFLFTFLYAIGFTGNIGVPKSIDSGTPVASMGAALINIVLLSVFALQHSIMARPAFKRWWSGIIPVAIERSTYVLQASLALILMFWQWNALDGIVWEAEQTVLKYGLTALFFAGWGIVLLATFMINHFELFGLKQVFDHFKAIPADHPDFKTGWLYKIVRHPIMLGFLIAFWATPVMTVGHLVFTLTTTAYILVAVHFLEEKDLKKSIGKKYIEYQQNVPMLIPFTKRKKINARHAD